MFGKDKVLARLELLVEELNSKKEEIGLLKRVENIHALLSKLELKFNDFLREKNDSDGSFMLFVNSQNLQHEEINKILNKLKKKKSKKRMVKSRR